MENFESNIYSVTTTSEQLIRIWEIDSKIGWEHFAVGNIYSYFEQFQVPGRYSFCLLWLFAGRIKIISLNKTVIVIFIMRVRLENGYHDFI